MKQIAILGLSYFGKNVLEELLEMKAEVLIIDRDRDLIDTYSESPVAAVVMDIVDENNLRKTLPKGIDGVVIDMGEKIEASILATSYCRKLGVPQIVVKAVTEGHAEILELVGATKIVFPNREAAKRITPQLVSSWLLNYLPISKNLVIAEVEIPAYLHGQSLLSANVRQKFGITIIAIKHGDEGEYSVFAPNYEFLPADIALVSGTDTSIEEFATHAQHKKTGKDRLNNLRRLFSMHASPKR